MKAVIYDVGGTLADSNDLHAEAWRGAVAVYKDVSNLLGHYDESPLAKERAAPAEGGRA